MKAHLVKTVYFEAAHRNLEGGAAQQRLHGHSYCLDILASGTPDQEIGWVVDFAELKYLFAEIEAQLDHAYLNELPGLSGQPTLPNLKKWILGQLDPVPEWLDDIQLSIVGDLAFTPTKLPAASPIALPERIRFTFEAAQSLPHLPGNHPCKVLHGHSYRLEIGAADCALLIPRLENLYNRLDHRYLNEVPGLEQATCERICAWIWEQLDSADNPLTVVVVQETNSSRCLYYGI